MGLRGCYTGEFSWLAQIFSRADSLGWFERFERFELLEPDANIVLFAVKTLISIGYGFSAPGS